MPPVALIDRVEAAIAGIAYTQAAPANAAEQQALQQTKTLSGNKVKKRRLIVSGVFRPQPSLPPAHRRTAAARRSDPWDGARRSLRARRVSKLADRRRSFCKFRRARQ